MADKRISQLTELVTPNGAVDIVPVMDTSTNKTKRALLSKLPLSDSAINHSFPFTTDITSDTATTQNFTSLSSSSGFHSNTNLTSIYVGTAVTSIGNNTFMSCTNLIDVTLSPNITSIGTNAFDTCSDLPSITIPSSVTSIGDDAFKDCFKLTSITILATSAPTLGVGAFSLAGASQINVPAGATASYKSAGDGTTYGGLTIVEV